MKRLVWTCLGAALLLGGAGCDDPAAPTAQDALIGNWAWVESTGGIAGMTLTPASTGQTMTLRFVSTDSVELQRDGALVGASKFTLATGEDGRATQISYEHPIFGFATQSVRMEGDDTLILSDGCCDGFSYRFERAP